MAENTKKKIAIVLKGYPRLSETFIAQEILALEQRGWPLDIWSLRHPTDPSIHPMHKAIKSPVFYLPEYLYQAPFRVLAGAFWALRQPGFAKLIKTFWRDYKREPTANRIRRLGQAMVIGRELSPSVVHLHVHFLHTPGSVVYYTAILTNRQWTFSAHAKDIWTTPEWEKREKIKSAAWGVTCTQQGAEYLNSLTDGDDKVTLVYHGLDLSRFPDAPKKRADRDGSDASNPVRIMSVGRAVTKKGFDDLIKALAALPKNLHWQFVHVGGGELLAALKQQARNNGIDKRIIFMGPKNQTDIITLLREADMFVLPSKQAKSGDQDGLPNVLMEAATQKLAIIASNFAGIPEFIRDGKEGVLTPPSDWGNLSNAINMLARDPARRHKLGTAAYKRLRSEFSMDGGIDIMEDKFQQLFSAKPYDSH
ncbi:glycosyltransferase family 4 protein [Microvirga sp. W0021]|uniref:Glycosyltransferase family 4 protein n=1 Tax=Hohaiivirga grylli TaxID=3133970 RepID=A0ABV0BGB1_9HYPH